MTSDNSAFTAGIRPGGLTSTDEVLVLLCCMMDHVRVPVTFDQLNEAMQKQELVNYFEFTDMLTRMLKKGYAVCDDSSGAGGFTITELGKLTAHECSYNLPAAILERGNTALDDIVTRDRRQQENGINVEKTEDGFVLTLAIRDIKTDMMKISLLLPDERSCELIRRRFINDPAGIYKGVFGVLSGDTSALGEPGEPAKDLFE